jgi:phage terminase large subunit-like protein
VSDIFASGIVWAPNRRWAEEVIDEVASFPAGENDDYVDSTIMALMRFRQGGFLRLPSDEAEEPQYKRRNGAYY